MGNCIEQYRAAIGNIYSACRQVIRLEIFVFFKLQHILSFINMLMRMCSFSSFHRVYGITLYIFLFMYFYSLVLILSGDIETNPGPTNESVVDIIHLNVRSIRNKIDSLNAIVSDFDIACFTETHLDHKISNNDILLDGFDIIFRKDRNS